MEIRTNRDDAYKVLSDPEIYATIAEDGVVGIPMPEDFLYVCGYVPDLIGCFILHEQNCITYECHVQVLPEYRKEYAYDFGKRVIEWTWENTRARKIVAQIPFLYPNVRDFALDMNFQIEGINKQSYLKDGEVFDQWHLGIVGG